MVTSDPCDFAPRALYVSGHLPICIDLIIEERSSFRGGNPLSASSPEFPEM